MEKGHYLQGIKNIGLEVPCSSENKKSRNQGRGDLQTTCPNCRVHQ